MKKTYLSILVCFAFLGALVFISSCKKESASANTAIDKEAQIKRLVVDDNLMIRYCGTPKFVDLIAGQHTVAGSVMVANTGSALYVTYTTTGDWKMSAIHLYVGECGKYPQSNGGPIPGKFPIKATLDPMQTTVTYVIDGADYENLGACFCVLAHADLKRVVDGIAVESQTGWGKGQDIPGANWAMQFEYCKQACTPPPPTVCLGSEETATGNGDLFANAPGNNWFEFSAYPQPAGGNVDIITGAKNTVIGSANFSAINNGWVTITITLNDDWKLVSGTETVKVQPSNTSPMTWQSPGSFLYKGNSLTVSVPCALYYAIHLSVAPVVPCP